MEATIFESVLSKYQGKGREVLLPLLWEIQTAEGYISKAAVHAISHTLHVPEADIFGVISFYTLFHDKPTGKTIIRVCTDPVCGLAKADKLLVDLENVCADGDYTLESSPCLGLCDHAPAALISKRGMGEISVPDATVESSLLTETQSNYPSHTESQSPVLLKTSSNDYAALRHALSLRPEEIIEEVIASGLIGRGGAAFPTGMKWRYTRQAGGKPYLVCNADESEPGTFKDRVLLEHHPDLVLEGIALAAYAISAEEAYIFIRGEYPVAEKVIREAYQSAREKGYFGKNIMGTNYSLTLEIRRGAGAYICGEETALFEAIEGKRGFPRIKPPYPTTHGLFGKPTVVNNVETLAAVPAIVQNGGTWFKQFGTEKSAGTKLVSVSGHVQKAGVYEIVPSLSLRTLLYDYCGVVGELQAVLMGGASGSFLSPSDIDVPLSFEDLRAIGSTFGSGAIMVFNSTVDLRDVLRRLGHFFQHESCGKCFPCQLGTQRQLEILERLDAPLKGDSKRLRDIGITMTEASLCGLGQTAASAVMSAMKKFPELFAERQSDD